MRTVSARCVTCPVTSLLFSLLLSLLLIDAQPRGTRGAAAAVAHAGQPVPGIYEERVLTVAGVERSYVLYHSAHPDDRAPKPLVLVLHGTGGRPEGMIRRGFSEQLSFRGAAGDRPFILVYPRGLPDARDSTMWNPQRVAERADDLPFIAELLDVLQCDYVVDPARIYSVGFSVGAAMSYRLACDLSATIAAVGIVAPAMAPFLTVEDCGATRPVPVLHIHGTLDEAYERAAAMVTFWHAHNGCDAAPMRKREEHNGQVVRTEISVNCRANGEVRFYSLEGGEHVWPGDPAPGSGLNPSMGVDATSLIWQFFQDHPLP
jgi:polyhydroxybutyrate depolymerase